jgi:hypothetical protein
MSGLINHTNTLGLFHPLQRSVGVLLTQIFEGGVEGGLSQVVSVSQRTCTSFTLGIEYNFCTFKWRAEA